VSTVRIEADGNECFRVSGALTFVTVRGALRSSQPLLLAATELTIDLSGVSSGDSAGLSLLIEWYRIAILAGKKIRFVGVPAQLQALAKIGDVDKLLGLAAG
jgi:phospholipid transport system transporter-binding protein